MGLVAVVAAVYVQGRGRRLLPMSVGTYMLSRIGNTTIEYLPKWGSHRGTIYVYKGVHFDLVQSTNYLCLTQTYISVGTYS